ncbi:MAG: response regulator [Nitrospinota bacterium]
MQNPQPTILVVEDSPSARQLLDKVFEDNGCRLLHAIGVNDSKRFIDAERVDLAVVDYWLPDGEGSEVIKYVEAQRPGAQALIVTTAG